MRDQVLVAAERRSRKLGKPAVEALLLVPDVFVLLVRLALDKQVPGEARALIGGALAYFVLPLDLFPEAAVGGVGYLDDLRGSGWSASVAVGGIHGGILRAAAERARAPRRRAAAPDKLRPCRA